MPDCFKRRSERKPNKDIAVMSQMLESKLLEKHNYFLLTCTRKKIPHSEILISDGDQVLRRAVVAKLDFPSKHRKAVA